MTTGVQRLQAAVNGENSDRVPVFCGLIDQGPGELGMSPEEYYADGAHVAEAQLRMREKYGYDNLWSLFYVGKEAELMGCRKIRFATGGAPNVEDFVIKTLKDIARLKVPEHLAAHPAFRQELKCLAILKREAGGKYPICAYITSTMTLPALLMGMEKWLELLFIGPSRAREVLLAKCHAFFVKEMKTYRDAGADILVYSNPFGSTDTVPMKFFMERSLPWIEKDIRAVGTEGVTYYCGSSRLNRVLDTVVERTGIGAYYLSPLDDVAEGKRIVAGRGLTCGVLNDIRLIEWNKKEIRNQVKNIMEAGMPGGKFLFGTGVVPCQVPERNIRIMLEAAYEFGSQSRPT